MAKQGGGSDRGSVAGQVGRADGEARRRQGSLSEPAGSRARPGISGGSDHPAADPRDPPKACQDRGTAGRHAGAKVGLNVSLRPRRRPPHVR
eukprot:scaffold470_cov257-Pinguiococcus_pyrenoidosus.AAC.37